MPPLKGIDTTPSALTPPGTFGVLGDSGTGFGVIGTTSGGSPAAGVYGQSDGPEGLGVMGVGSFTGVVGKGPVGVLGTANGGGSGVAGTSTTGQGVSGQSTSGPG